MGIYKDRVRDTEAGNVGTTEHTEHTEARGNRLRVVFRGRVEGEWYLSNSSKTQGKHAKVRFLSSPLKNPGFPRVFCISGQLLWPSVAPMQLGAWRLRRCISRRAAKIESFFESRESSKHWGFEWPGLVPTHVGGGGRIRTSGWRLLGE